MAPRVQPIGPDRSGGDHPPTALYALEGNGGLATDVALNGTMGTFELPVTALAGENTVTLTTGEDLLGWHFAAPVTPLTTTPAEKTSWGGLKSKFC